MKKTDKIARFIDTKIFPSGIIPNLLIFALGSVLYYGFVHDKNISGSPTLIIAGICFVLLGVGVYGIFSWVGRKTLQLISSFFRLVLRGQINISVDNKGPHFRFHIK